MIKAYKIVPHVIGLFLFLSQSTTFAKEINCTQLADYTNLTYLLIDRSGEPASINSLKRTFLITQQNLTQKKSAERLIVGVITGKASDTRGYMDRVKPENSWTESALTLRKKKKLFEECIKQNLTEFIKTPENHKTSAVLETLKFVAEVFHANSAKQKRLIIYSDMIQNTSTLKFYGKQIKLFGKPTKKPPETFITSLRKQYMIPDFKNVDVYIAGTGGTVSDQRALLVERFWKEYFKNSGAKLHFYGPLLTGL